MRKIIIIVLLLFLVNQSLPALAQKPLRIEIAAKEDTDPFNLVNCAGLGVFVFFPTAQEVGNDSIVWSFYMFDKDLKEIWNNGIGIGRSYIFAGSLFKANDARVYLLFQDGRKKEGNNVVVFTVDLSRSIVKEIKGQLTAMANIGHFEVAENYAFITLETKKGGTELCRMSLKTADVMHFSIPDQEKSVILNLSLNPENRSISAVSKTEDGLLKLTDFSYDGTLLRTVGFNKMSAKKETNTAEVIHSGRAKGLVFGVYGSENYRARNSEPEGQNPLAAGYFVAGFEKEQNTFVKYYNFSEFRDFFRYVNGDDAIRLKKRSFLKDKDKDDESRETALNYHMLIHPVLQRDSSFILTGEAYYPEYHTITNMMYDYYGRPIPTSYSVFDGFRYAVAFIASFDSSGTMRWSNGMEMRGILTNLLNRKFSGFFDGVDYVMMYNAEGSLAMKTIRGNEVLEQSVLTPLGMLHANDKVVKDYLSTVEPWYGDFYLAYGYHSIRNNDLSDSRRTVFYINKIAYR
jgi:hypothetical protein